MDTSLFSPVIAYILFWLLRPVTFSKLLVQVRMCVAGGGGGIFRSHSLCKVQFLLCYLPLPDMPHQYWLYKLKWNYFLATFLCHCNTAMLYKWIYERSYILRLCYVNKSEVAWYGLAWFLAEWGCVVWLRMAPSRVQELYQSFKKLNPISKQYCTLPFSFQSPKSCIKSAICIQLKEHRSSCLCCDHRGKTSSRYYPSASTL